MAGHPLALDGGDAGMGDTRFHALPCRLFERQTGQQAIGHRAEGRQRGKAVGKGIPRGRALVQRTPCSDRAAGTRGRHRIAVQRQVQLQSAGQTGKERTERNIDPLHLQAIRAGRHVAGQIDHRHEMRLDAVDRFALHGMARMAAVPAGLA